MTHFRTHSCTMDSRPASSKHDASSPPSTSSTVMPQYPRSLGRDHAQDGSRLQWVQRTQEALPNSRAFNTLNKSRRTFCASQPSQPKYGRVLVSHHERRLWSWNAKTRTYLGEDSHISFLVGLAAILGVGGIQAWTHCYQSRTWQRRKPLVRGSRNGLLYCWWNSRARA